MVKTWIADVAPLADESIYRSYYEMASMERQKKADKIARTEDKALSIGVWSLYEKVCRGYQISERAIYNFSHSGQYVLCAIEDSEDPNSKVGCDLEQMGRLRLAVAKRFFCPAEYAYIEGQPSKEAQQEAFYRYWVLKESFMKATRKGMKLPLRAFEIQMNENRPPHLIRVPEDIKEEYFYMEYDIPTRHFVKPYKAAVCSTSCEIAQTLEWVLL